MASSNISRLTRSASRLSALSPDATTAPSVSASRGTVPRPTPNCMRPPEQMSAMRVVLGQAQRVPLGHDVEHLAQAQPLGLVDEVQPEQDEVGDDLVALVLEVVLGQPHGVEAEPVHRPGPVGQVVVAGHDVVVAVAPLDRQGPGVAGVGHGDRAVEVRVDPHAGQPIMRRFPDRVASVATRWQRTRHPRDTHRDHARRPWPILRCRPLLHRWRWSARPWCGPAPGSWPCRRRPRRGAGDRRAGGVGRRRRGGRGRRRGARRHRVRGGPRAGQRPSPPVPDRVPDPPRHPARADGDVAGGDAAPSTTLTGVDAELAGAAAAAGLAEALLSGVTTVADHHLTWPGDVDACTAHRRRHRRGGPHARCPAGAGAGRGGRRPRRSPPPRPRPWSRWPTGSQVTVAVGPAGVHSDRREHLRRPGRGGGPPRPAPPDPGQRGGRRRRGRRALRPPAPRPAGRVGLAGARRDARPPVRGDARRGGRRGRLGGRRPPTRRAATWCWAGAWRRPPRCSTRAWRWASAPAGAAPTTPATCWPTPGWPCRWRRWPAAGR